MGCGYIKDWARCELGSECCRRILYIRGHEMTSVSMLEHWDDIIVRTVSTLEDMR